MVSLETLHGMNIALEGFNASSANLYASLSKDFDRYTRQMKQLKEDLDQIFRRIRSATFILHLGKNSFSDFF
jgi:hypothetical protein